ncbi:MAG: hypothetical protein JWO37_1953 [Acidimicrobiales bacterium]|nr:hypothetical protein [Acidimicrobiales bacterium]
MPSFTPKDGADVGEARPLTERADTRSIDSAEERIKLIQRLYDSTIEQDLFADAYAEHFTWHAPKGRGTLMGDHQGRAYIEEAFAHVVSISSEFNSVIGEILADDECVISFNRDYGVRASDGAKFDFDVAIRWHVADGQIQEMWEYIQDEEHKGEFF